MALAKLGGIITGLAGSIGGTTIRRVGGSISLYNKVNNASLSQVQQNVGLVNIALLSREYTTTPEAVKNAWKSFANSFLFPNRFGDPRKISGKSMWMKCNGTLSHFNEFLEIPDGKSIDVPRIDLDYLEVDFNTSEFLIGVESPVTLARYFVRIVKLRYPGQNIVFNRQKVLFAGDTSNTPVRNYFNDVEEQFGRISVGDEYQVGVYGVAEVGFPLLMFVQRVTFLS